MARLSAQFITMFDEPIKTWLSHSILARAMEKNILEAEVKSILQSVNNNHHKIDDTPYGGGPGELMRIDVMAPLIKQALADKPDIDRSQKRVILMDPAGQKFDQACAKRLSQYHELIFVSGRYEGIDARIHHYVDEAISVGDFVLSSGDLAAMTIFDATARMIEGVLGSFDSIASESHMAGRLEASHYTRPKEFDGHAVPDILSSGNHAVIERSRAYESLLKTATLRPDLLDLEPMNDEEKKLMSQMNHAKHTFPWQKSREKKFYE